VFDRLESSANPPSDTRLDIAERLSQVDGRVGLPCPAQLERRGGVARPCPLSGDQLRTDKPSGWISSWVIGEVERRSWLLSQAERDAAGRELDLGLSQWLERSQRGCNLRTGKTCRRAAPNREDRVFDRPPGDRELPDLLGHSADLGN